MAKRQVLLGRILVLTALTLGCLFSTTQAGVVNITTTASEATAWDGFGPDFEPEWEGKTTEVTTWQSYQNIDPGWIYTGGTGIMISGGCWNISSGCWSSDVTILAGNWLAGLTTYTVVPGYWETHSTVRKVASSSGSSVTNSTLIRIGGTDYKADKNDSGKAEMACFAELVSPSDELLANASSIAYKTAEFDEDDFSGSGRVSSFAVLSTATLSPEPVTPEPVTPEPVVSESTITERIVFTPPSSEPTFGPVAFEPAVFKPIVLAPIALEGGTLEIAVDYSFIQPIAFNGSEICIGSPISRTPTGEVEQAEAKANGHSWISGTYGLDQETNFSLELDIARLGDVTVSFSAIDTATGEEAFSLPVLEPDSQQTINIDGSLEAGTYKFSLNCETTAELDSDGTCNLGGEAEFDLAFDLEEEYYDVWVPGYLLYSNGTKVYDYEELYDEILSGETTFNPSITWEDGDFNGDSEVTVSDLTILASNWQYGIQACSVAVPEPSTLVMLLLGVLSGFGASRRFVTKR